MDSREAENICLQSQIRWSLPAREVGERVISEISTNFLCSEWPVAYIGKVDWSCTCCSPHSTSPAHLGDPCELPLVKSFGGTCFRGRSGRFDHIVQLCFTVSAQRSACWTPALRLWECLWPHHQHLLALAGPPSPSVPQHFGFLLSYPKTLSFAPGCSHTTTGQCFRMQKQAHKHQTSLFLFLPHRTYQNT